MNAEPFSFSIVAADVPAEGRRYRIEADEEQRRGLAELLDIPAVESLTAELEVRPVHGSALSVRGGLKASVVQTDVVSLDPVEQSVAEDIDVTLIQAQGAASRRAGKELVDAAEADGPDLYHQGRIDLGIIVREHLALGLDPYPRASDAEFPGHIEDEPGHDPSPFAALAALKTGGE